MSRYSVGTSKAGVNTANTTMWQIRCGASQRAHLLELALYVEVAPTNAPVWRLNRPTATGTSSATATFQPEDPDIAAAATVLDTAWSVNPTLGGTDLRRFGTPGTIGSGIVWTWYDAPLVIPKSGGICVVNANAAGTTLGTLGMYCLIGE